MKRLDDLRISLFSDGADLPAILEMYANPRVRGFTTNPTLMRKAGVCDYEVFARELLRRIPDRPISFEVFADSETEMALQALTLASWGANVNVKIPVTTRDGLFLGSLIRDLSQAGVELNVTAILTLDQVDRVAQALSSHTPAIVSVFAGRIADTGVDPVPLMAEAASLLLSRPRTRLLWASTRELLNVFQAEEAGCDIITLSPDLLRKLEWVGRDLTACSRETVEMFHRDAQAAAYQIDTGLLRPERSVAVLAQDDVDRFGKIGCAVIRHDASGLDQFQRA